MTPALTLTLSPGEREQPSRPSRFMGDFPANSGVRFFRKTADYSPSPGGEGWGEDERLN
jgi:hypothetical protein